MYRDKIRFICVNSINETSEWILKIATRLLKNPQNFNNENQTSSKYIECTKIKSKNYINRLNWPSIFPVLSPGVFYYCH